MANNEIIATAYYLCNVKIPKNVKLIMIVSVHLGCCERSWIGTKHVFIGKFKIKALVNLMSALQTWHLPVSCFHSLLSLGLFHRGTNFIFEGSVFEAYLPLIDSTP